jgi:hypothetical protein
VQQQKKGLVLGFEDHTCILRGDLEGKSQGLPAQENAVDCLPEPHLGGYVRGRTRKMLQTMMEGSREAEGGEERRTPNFRDKGCDNRKAAKQEQKKHSK